MNIYKIERVSFAGRNSKVAEEILNARAEQGYRAIKILPMGTSDALVILELQAQPSAVAEEPVVAPAKRGPGRPKKVVVEE